MTRRKCPKYLSLIDLPLEYCPSDLIANDWVPVDRYALFFAFDSSEAGRTKISNIISNLKSGANADLGTGPRPGEAKGHIHIGCQDTVESDGEDACERGPVFTESAEDSPSSHVNFCPDFWEKPRFDQLKTANSDDVYSWFYDPGFKGTDGM